jgi:hypothetical protein
MDTSVLLCPINGTMITSCSVIHHGIIGQWPVLAIPARHQFLRYDASTASFSHWSYANSTFGITLHSTIVPLTIQPKNHNNATRAIEPQTSAVCGFFLCQKQVLEKILMTTTVSHLLLISNNSTTLIVPLSSFLYRRGVAANREAAQ